MKANEAPEKIYLERILCSNEVYDTWKSQKTISDDIEYIRKDAFIEKAAKWLEDNAIEYWGTDAVDNGMMIYDFKNAMKL